MLLAAQVSYLRAGEARGIGGGGVVVKGGWVGVEAVKQITQRLNFTRKQRNTLWTLKPGREKINNVVVRYGAAIGISTTSTLDWEKN